MKKIGMIAAALALAGATLACSFSINAPEVKTIDTQELVVNEAAPTGVAGALVKIEMGAGKLNLSGGASGLVEGSIHYNVFGWDPKVTRENGGVRVSQSRIEDFKIPSNDIINEWDLSLGTFPTELEISAGAYEGNIDLSGVALTNLTVEDGASQATVEFNSLNPIEMADFSYKTGASQVKIFGIGNANTSTFSFDGGAGDYTLDFSGELQKDLEVKVNSGVSKIEIRIPDGVPVRVNVTGGLNNVSPRGTWSINGSVYEKEGTGPRIDIMVDMGVGSLDLISQ
ncbi:MAG TPA: toast rack family protein [Bellilinea sp.]|nr:toast rack family protein [Bellilinea sp.]